MCVYVRARTVECLLFVFFFLEKEIAKLESTTEQIYHKGIKSVGQGVYVCVCACLSVIVCVPQSGWG